MAPNSPSQGPQLSLHEAAQLLQVSERTIRRWVEGLAMPCSQGAGAPVFDRGELIEWANAHSFRLAMDVPGDSEGPLPDLAAAIERGGIHYDVPGRDVDAALEEVSLRLELPELVDRAFFHQVLLAREDLGSTGIGDGVAIPHVRAPLVLHVDEPLVGLFLLERPVDWAAIDGKPVDTLFVVVSPGVRSHLHLLSRISFALRDDMLRSMLVGRGDSQIILGRLRELDAQVRTTSDGMLS